MNQLPQAVLWDMDGTLIDSEPYWIEQESALMREAGVPWTEEDAMQLVGQALFTSADILIKHGNLRATREEVTDHLVKGVSKSLAENIPWQPGAKEALKVVRDAGIKQALVTMSFTKLAHTLMDSLDFAPFDVMVTGDTVTHGKPHPEPYLTGAAKLGVDIKDCVAVEDSPPGLQSAVSSGARVIAVPHVVPIGPGDGYTLISSLKDFSLDLMRSA